MGNTVGSLALLKAFKHLQTPMCKFKQESKHFYFPNWEIE